MMALLAGSCAWGGEVPFRTGNVFGKAVKVAGDVCFVGGSKSGLEFIDVSRPQNPQLIRCVKKEPVESQSVAYRDGLLFSGEWGGKCVTIWDARGMASPTRLACCPLASNGDGVWVDGNWLYASTGFSVEDKKPGATAHPGQMVLKSTTWRTHARRRKCRAWISSTANRVRTTCGSCAWRTEWRSARQRPAACTRWTCRTKRRRRRWTAGCRETGIR
ncbi:MAG: hypothetical protein IJL17_16980 [Kiritimatiellae bacterium]|nr:hypothetical protein [Kiritimatiellia bacterium]